MRKFTFLWVCLLAVLYVQAQTTVTELITSSGSWTVPSGVTSVQVEAWGGGGAGGYAKGTWTDLYKATGSGGGGAYAASTVTVTPGEIFTITVGTGGVGNTESPGNGTASRVIRSGTTLVLAVGGTGASYNKTAGGAGGEASECIGDISYSGGSGGNSAESGAYLATGGGGAAASAFGDGEDGTDGTATVISSDAGNGGKGHDTNPGNHGSGANGVRKQLSVEGYTGNDGSTYGGGGSGAISVYRIFSSSVAKNGGSGAQGVVRLTYIQNTCDATPGVIAAQEWICTTNEGETSSTVVVASSTDVTSTSMGTYFWESSADDISWSTIADANASTYVATATNYYRRGYSVGGCENVYSNAVHVVNPSDVTPGYVQYENNTTNMQTSVCMNTEANVTLTTDLSVDGSTITWQTSTDQTNWTNASTGLTYNFQQTNFSTTTYIRFLYYYSATCDIPSNNLFTVYPVELPVLDSITGPSDLCQGRTSYEVTAWATEGDGAINSYVWTDDANGTGSTATISSTLPNSGNTYNYAVYAVDENGCNSNTVSGSFTLLSSISDEGAITDFTHDTVFITLWYGACDTLYSVTAPTWTNHVESCTNVSLGNDKNNENEGTILGRLDTGRYTITWTLTDQSAPSNTLSYEQVFIVRYPNCGENDPSYTEAYRVTDADGNVYSTVRVGCDCWMAQNLRSTTYHQDGDSIAVAKVYNSDLYSSVNDTIFGRLYSWYSTMKLAESDDTNSPVYANDVVSGDYVQGVCPEGWAVPTNDELQNMITSASGIDNVKSSNASTWLTGYEGAAPGSGFDAVGAGYYNYSTSRYENLLGQTYYWTSTPCTSTYDAVTGKIIYSCSDSLQVESNKNMGYSVRCIKKQGTVE